jgi:hypothetical protein
MENFPWTRLANVALPSGRKAPIDVARLRLMDAAGVRAYIGDGNFGGEYEQPDDVMNAVWRAGRRRHARGYRRSVGVSVERRFEHRTVIVTGAAHGFGRAIALRFAELGARRVRLGHRAPMSFRKADAWAGPAAGIWKCARWT